MAPFYAAGMYDFFTSPLGVNGDGDGTGWDEMLCGYGEGVVILYGVNSFANALASTDEYKNDPRNPVKPAAAH
ncbi:hypothetical protein EJ08DRAFT_696149 [Tothia fuscella]|uniref:Uncharacterized protein n=1 Tax=Tothia fuscella TaxID=1048955 RepID=A0A9P4NTZ7_9PEZI|nr:hypothetical protein EJ08DRAFT_696149 [Tothia fuscella]